MTRSSVDIKELIEALDWFVRNSSCLKAEVKTAHDARRRNAAVSGFMIEDDFDFSRDLDAALHRASRAIVEVNSIPATTACNGKGFIVLTDDGIEYTDCLTGDEYEVYRRSTYHEEFLHAQLRQAEIEARDAREAYEDIVAQTTGGAHG